MCTRFIGLHGISTKHILNARVKTPVLGSKNKYCQITKNIGAVLAQILNFHACATLKITGDLI
jgi:hypothetical protein